MRIVEPSAELLRCDDERLIETCGRVCYLSGNKATDTSYRQFIRRLIERGHESVLEHCSATVLLTTDRGISHELVRHRIAAYSQESTRYVSATDMAVVLPSGLNDYQRAEMLPYLRASETACRAMTSLGCRREEARAVLPTCLATRLAMTANFREWRHIFRLRLAPAAHPDMRRLMVLVVNLLVAAAPVTFEEFGEVVE